MNYSYGSGWSLRDYSEKRTNMIKLTHTDSSLSLCLELYCFGKQRNYDFEIGKDKDSSWWETFVVSFLPCWSWKFLFR